MKSKLKGSFLIWIICILILTSTILSTKMKRSFEKNRINRYAIKSFICEQELFSFMLQYSKEFRQEIYYNILKNKKDGKKVQNWELRLKPKKFKDDTSIKISDIYINDSTLYYYLFLKRDEYNIIRAFSFIIDTVPELFLKCDDKIIDNNSKNDIQFEKNLIINKLFNNLKMKNILGIQIINLDLGEYIILVDRDFYIIYKNGEIYEKLKKSSKLAVISGGNNSTVKIESDKLYNFDELYVVNKGDVFLNNISFNGLICIKNGDLISKEIKGSGRIIIDGQSKSSLGNRKILLNNFKIKNKYLLNFEAFENLRIRNFKR